MNNSDRQNPRRLIRAIEIVILSETKGLSRMRVSDKLRDSSLIVQNDNVISKNILKIGLTAPREILYNRIDERVISRIDQGMIQEAEKLHKQGLSYKRMRQLGLEYGILADFLECKIKSKEELIQILQGKIHGYARRQITWFKNPLTNSGYTHWFDITDKSYIAKLENTVRKWYDDHAYAAKN